jgi:carboxylesterase
MTQTEWMPIIGAAALLAAALWTWSWRRRVAHRFEQSDATRRPRDARGVVIGAEELRLAGENGRAVLLLHGFNDTPQSMRHLATRLHAAGYTVHALRLPGHGCSLPELARHANAAAWRGAVHAAYERLQRDHRAVYVCGQSMGAALAVLLARSHGEMPAVALLAPFIGIAPALAWKFRLARLSPAPYHRSLGGERSLHDAVARRAALGPGIVTAGALNALREIAVDAEAVLREVQVPTLFVQSVHDNRVSAEAGERHFGAIAATDKEQLWLSGSGHIISADFERDLVADRVIAWFDAHGGACAQRPESGSSVTPPLA